MSKQLVEVKLIVEVEQHTPADAIEFVENVLDLDELQDIFLDNRVVIHKTNVFNASDKDKNRYL